VALKSFQVKQLSKERVFKSLLYDALNFYIKKAHTELEVRTIFE